ncbi:MAG TPA: hypothetical protein VL088_09205 [Pedobacter sp.]|nr:hypothetical protein [Pedobacter sp.]
MKKIAVLLLIVFCAIVVLESCSSRLCPAYSTYPEGKKKRG